MKKLVLLILAIIPSLTLFGSQDTSQEKSTYNECMNDAYKNLFQMQINSENNEEDPIYHIRRHISYEPWSNNPKACGKEGIKRLIQSFEKCARSNDITAQQYIIDMKKLSEENLVKHKSEESYWSRYIISNIEVRAAKNLDVQLYEKLKPEIFMQGYLDEYLRS